MSLNADADKAPTSASFAQLCIVEAAMRVT
ncbi:hypothetical protein HDG37_002505 [Paraburkholderia sp. MM5384-R2]|nr:hypothetical protein [Paraburkholderia sp. MM5384-R2]